MTPKQEQHLQFIIAEFKRLYEPKYRAGQKEHGGDLWRKKGIIDFASHRFSRLFINLKRTN